VRVVITAGTDSLGETQSDSTGRFQLAVKPRATVVAHFSRVGFRHDSIAYEAGSELPLRVAMIPAGGAATLAAMTVRGSGGSTFERRAKRNAGGTFISAEDIEKRQIGHTTELLRRVPGVSLSDSAGMVRVVSQRRLRHAPPNPRLGTTTYEYRECVLLLGVDGRIAPEGFSINDIQPGKIFGIEIYVGPANIPAEFSSVQGDGSCGLVMIWTKTGRERR
jgi:hypothetical protein